MKFLTAQQMADLLQCSYQTFNSWVKRRGLPFYAVGRKRVFDLEKVLPMLETVEIEKALKPASKGRSLILNNNNGNNILDSPRY